MPVASAEFVHVAVLPPHRGLQHVVQLRQSQVGRHQKPDGVVEELAVPQRRGVLRDQVIFLYKLAQAASMRTSGGSSSTMKSTIEYWCF